MYRQPYIQGFSTNPTLMRKAGVRDYEAFARDVIAAIPDRPISFEVFADDWLDELCAPAVVTTNPAAAAPIRNVFIVLTSLEPSRLRNASSTGNPSWTAAADRATRRPHGRGAAKWASCPALAVAPHEPGGRQAVAHGRSIRRVRAIFLVWRAAYRRESRDGYGGSIEVQSNDGDGTTVRVRWPRRDSPP